jgi:hypothetical protein
VARPNLSICRDHPHTAHRIQGQIEEGIDDYAVPLRRGDKEIAEGRRSDLSSYFMDGTLAKVIGFLNDQPSRSACKIFRRLGTTNGQKTSGRISPMLPRKVEIMCNERPHELVYKS